jgi:hypothetical protein
MYKCIYINSFLGAFTMLRQMYKAHLMAKTEEFLSLPRKFVSDNDADADIGGGAPGATSSR